MLITASFRRDDGPGLSTIQNLARVARRSVCGLDPLIKGQRTNLRLRHPQLVDQLPGAPGCFSGCTRAKASIVESELAIRVKFKNGAGRPRKFCSRSLAREADVSERDRVVVAIAAGGGLFQMRFERGERGVCQCWHI